MRRFISVYNLEKDRNKKRIRKKYGYSDSLEAVDGLVPESPSWWKAIAEGKIEKITLEGSITRVYMSGHNDYAQFAMKSFDDVESDWTRNDNGTILSRLRAKILYKPGNKVRIKYTLQPWRADLKPKPGCLDWSKEPPYKLVTSIEIASA